MSSIPLYVQSMIYVQPVCLCSTAVDVDTLDQYCFAFGALTHLHVHEVCVLHALLVDAQEW